MEASALLKQVGTAAGALGAFASTVADHVERIEAHALQQQQVLQVLGQETEMQKDQIKQLTLRLAKAEQTIKELQLQSPTLLESEPKLQDINGN